MNNTYCMRYKYHKKLLCFSVYERIFPNKMINHFMDFQSIFKSKNKYFFLYKKCLLIIINCIKFEINMINPFIKLNSLLKLKCLHMAQVLLI